MARTLHLFHGKRYVRKVATAREHRVAAWHTSPLQRSLIPTEKPCTGAAIVQQQASHCNVLQG